MFLWNDVYFHKNLKNSKSLLEYFIKFRKKIHILQLFDIFYKDYILFLTAIIF